MGLALYLSRVRSSDLLGGSSLTRKEGPDFRLKEADKRGIHELEIVRNVEADYPLVLEMRSELLGDSVAVHALHDKNYVGPADSLG